MPLNKLDNFIKNVEGRILYVNPNDLDATDSITNTGNSLAQPFKTIQRALLEAARFSYVAGNNNDLVEKTTILLFPGEHVVDNRPGYAIYDNGGDAYAVSRSGGIGTLASLVLSLGLDSQFDLSVEDNILYKFNSFYGGVVVPRGTSIVGLDLRKTKLRPTYVPNPTDSSTPNSAIFRITGACYFWQFSFFDGNPTSLVYTNPDNSSSTYQSAPNFSHHKLTCFEYADGVNNILNYGLTDLDMYYSKVSNAFTAYRNIEEKFPDDAGGFAKQRPEWEIVGAFASDPLVITDLISGNGTPGGSSAIVTVTTEDPHQLDVGTPIKIKGVGTIAEVDADKYNISTRVQNILSPTSFTYLLPSFSSYPNINPNPTVTNATVTVETDTVSGASPYIFNISLRSVWGMNGMHADGAKASGFRSMVVAQFTGVSLQKDDRAFAKFNKITGSYQSVSPITAVHGSALPAGASQTDSTKVYHLDPDAVYRQGWETTHIRMSNNAFVQIVSVFAIGYNKHFSGESGSDVSITNSNSNFGQIALSASGFKNEAFSKDNNAFITSIIAPRAIGQLEQNIDWLSLDVGLTTSVGISSHLYIYGYGTYENSAFLEVTQGYKVGAKIGDKLYVNLGAGTSEANIYMCDNEISFTGFTTALGTTSSFKKYRVTSGPSSNSFTIGANNLLTGEKVKIISDDGNLPDGTMPHETYYVINNNDNNTIKLASSYTNAIQSQAITVYNGSNLNILSRVSDKESGDVGSPIQYDAKNKNWYIHVNADNQIYNAFNVGGTSLYGETTELSYIKRIGDERSLDEKLFKMRVVIPKELSNAKNPETGYIIQESSSTGFKFDSDGTKTSIGTSEYQYKKNLRFISTCSQASGTVTVLSELPHNLQVGDIVIVKNVKSTTNAVGTANSGYNGRFVISQVPDAYSFTYPVVDTSGVQHAPGTFNHNTNIRDTNLPRFERNDWQGNFSIYKSEVISEYIPDQQDGIYHLYVLNASNAINDEFTNLKFSQRSVDLYPQLDRDNIDDNPPSAKTYAKRSPIGDVVTNDLKKSITRETVDLFLKKVGIGLTFSSVVSTAGIATITFPRLHGLSGIVTGSISNGGATYAPTSGIQTYYNVKLLNGGSNPSSATWNGATAKVIVSSGIVTAAEIISGGSGYSAGDLYFDQTRIGTGNGAARFTIVTSGITTNVGDAIQVTGIGTTADGYYRITSVPTSTSIAIAKTAGDPSILNSQYLVLCGKAIGISSAVSDITTGITTFTSPSAHGLLTGNKFRILDSNNNNLGDYFVTEKIGVTTFVALTNSNINFVDGYTIKHSLSANNASLDRKEENRIGVHPVTFFANDTLTLVSAITTETTISVSSSGIGTATRLALGTYIQIDNEIMRVLSSNNNTTATVSRGALGTRLENHDANSLIRIVKPLAVEFRRPTIVRASGHTFEYLGYGPGNYSTGLPQVQVKTLSDQEVFLSQASRRSGGIIAYSGMNSSGDLYLGNTKTSGSSGETISFDIPQPTITGESGNKSSGVFDEVIVKEKLLVEGGSSGTVLSQFDGPVTFNGNVRLNSKTTIGDIVKITNGLQSSSSTTGDLVVSGGIGAYNMYVTEANIGTLTVSNSANFQNNLYVNNVPIPSYINARAIVFGL